MKEVLNALLDLQDIDEQLGELERSKVYLPEMIENITKEMKTLEEKLQENKEKLVESKKKQKQIELDVEEDRLKLAKYQDQMKVIKTNKEYDALVGEIDSKKQKIGDNEDEILKLMGIIDECNENISELELKLKEIRKTNKTHLDNLRNELASLESKIADKQEQRRGLTKTIDRKALILYERIRKGKGGMAVVPLRKKACGGCFKHIPPQMIQQIRRGDRIYTCDSCGRILIWVNEE
ncbi:MAG: hypothetical protein B6D58_04635 [candidate division Zixibacteria bacterium 4484_95]|nr:MAG: hypothetical protein B6D58_04635 [candidate division Zixibacteria bacterium 4484_95]